MNTFLATLIVLALVGALAWFVRRGPLARLAASKPVTVETAIPLGERRSLVIVTVEGRRLLLGLTSTNISLVTELGPSSDPSGDTGAGYDPHGGPRRAERAKSPWESAKSFIGLSLAKPFAHFGVRQ